MRGIVKDYCFGFVGGGRRGEAVLSRSWIQNNAFLFQGDNYCFEQIN